MTTEFLRVKKFHQEAARSLSLQKRMELQPELSLGPVWPGFAATGGLTAKSSSSESDGSSRKKRKHYTASWEEPQQAPASLELQLNDPLPLDWEQCLDLQVSTSLEWQLYMFSVLQLHRIRYARSLLIFSGSRINTLDQINKTTVIISLSLTHMHADHVFMCIY